MPNCLKNIKNVTMPDKKISSAKCHICGQKIPFTYGNPKELIQHMLGCHGKGSSQQFNPTCCPTNKPCVKIVDCPNKAATCTTCGGKRKTTSKSATLYDAPENAPIKCTICVAPPKEGVCNPECPNVSTSKRSSQKDDTCLPNCPNKSSSRINVASPLKLGSRGSGRNNPSWSKINHSKNKLDVNTGRNKNSSTSLINRSKDSLIKKCKKCVGQRMSRTPIETMRNASSCSLTPSICKESCIGQCKAPTEQNKNCPVDKTTSTCNKTVCFANNICEAGDKKVEYSPCNLIKRKGTKEMYKTTLETWTAGCGTIDCPKCHRKVVPLIRKQKNKIAFTSVGASLLLTCWPFCFLIPMMHNCSVDLYCPCCKYKLGVYNSSTGKTTSVCCKKNTPNT